MTKGGGADGNARAGDAADSAADAGDSRAGKAARLARIWGAAWPYFVAFSASACILIIEIVASRLLAPTIGVSLYTWTSIIGVVLAGISAGNYAGGVIADRLPSQATLGVLLMCAGLTSAAALPLVDVAALLYDGLHILPRIVLMTATLFLAPSVILGMVTPVVIKLRLRDLDSAGNVVGKIYAVSTAGSIFGVFATGFALIQWFGTRPILLGVAVFLTALALAFGGLWRLRSVGARLLPAVAVVAAVGVIGGSLKSECDVESNYFCINVREREIEGRTVRALRLDQLVHSYVDLDDPAFFAYGYEKVFADIATAMGERDPKFRALFIGGGGYTMPRFIEAAYPRSRVDVIEIDPAVTEVAHAYLGMARDTGIATYAGDARMIAPTLPRGAYDLVVGDAFNDVSVPYHLTTLEFNAQVRALLRGGGVYAVNVVDKPQSGEFLAAVVATLQAGFPYVQVMRDDKGGWDDDRQYTFVVAASLAPLEYDEIYFASHKAGRGNPEARLMPGDRFAAWYGGKRRIALTDDFAPVDNLLAPVYLDSR